MVGKVNGVKRGPNLKTDEALAMYQRVTSGQVTIAELARETGRDKSALYRLFNRRFGYKAGHAEGYMWQATLAVPDDVAVRAYIAGLVDGDGSIARRRDGYWAVLVGMTDEPVIDWLAAFGGRKSLPYSPSGNRQTVWQWGVNRRRDVVHLLDAIRPYLIVKARRADECLNALRYDVEAPRPTA